MRFKPLFDKLGLYFSLHYITLNLKFEFGHLIVLIQLLSMLILSILNIEIS